MAEEEDNFVPEFGEEYPEDAEYCGHCRTPLAEPVSPDMTEEEKLAAIEIEALEVTSTVSSSS